MIQAAFEHFGLNVADKQQTVDWYVENLGLKVVRDVPGKMAFLADANGVVMLEVYRNSGAPQLAFSQTDALAFHMAFEVDDAAESAERLVQAGATIVDPFKRAGDDAMVMLRDPFGVALQLVQRGNPMRHR